MDRLSIVRKTDLSDKINHNFFPSRSLLLYRCTILTLTKCIEKKLDGNCTIMLRTILNKSGKQHPQNSSCAATYLPSL